MPKETKSERFKRLATKRANDVLERIRILGNLSNKSAYEYTDEEIKRIFSSIDEQLRASKARFIRTKRYKFKL